MAAKVDMRRREATRDGMKLCFCVRTARRGGETGPGILYSRAKVEIRSKKRRREGAGEGLRVRSLFRSFINPPP